LRSCGGTTATTCRATSWRSPSTRRRAKRRPTRSRAKRRCGRSISPHLIPYVHSPLPGRARSTCSSTTPPWRCRNYAVPPMGLNCSSAPTTLDPTCCCTPDTGALPVLYAAVADLPGNSFAGPSHLGHMRRAPELFGRSAAAQDPQMAARLRSFPNSSPIRGFPCRGGPARSSSGVRWSLQPRRPPQPASRHLGPTCS
jgi:hypothetical protein